MIDVEPLIVSGLERLVPLPSGGRVLNDARFAQEGAASNKQDANSWLAAATGFAIGIAALGGTMSQGRATFTMQFDHYEQVPSAVAAEIQAKFA